VAYLMTDRWLANFACRTPMDAWVFLGAGAAALAIAALTVSFQSFSTANANPAEVLKDH
jgi:putative ABC transport system permease protein